MSEDTKLSSNTTVAEYKAMVARSDKDAIANFILERFTERYITPFSDKEIKHGFSMMSVSCLMIESLESFRQGWPNSNSRSALAFAYFFDRSEHFEELRGNHQAFYKHIRCGLLHQAETTGGWKINRKASSLVNTEQKVINATKFMECLKKDLVDYVELLKSDEWDSQIWKKTRAKINHICKQCES
ncbi:hypothetical protein ACRTDM_22120 [Shewanella algae]|uniref:Uncharacterized protein n=1 Tax=bacterium 19CA01SA08 TaxID=2920574 RepID=A0AAU6VY31_UNCXX|nr:MULTISPECIES: hypothetical protein [Shewanella]MBO2552059.1 hypothetical protein [Shewanella algae]MDE0567893.1 hypothetical protein [Shewanella sp. K8]PSS71655.1 hypothetical protein AYI85_04725 [Shewanella algae]TVL06878.1 hypothetical protein AYI84_02395 [Shewanella algae]TVL49054.1 hypothetical protein AYI99_16875 [Shewanella algae]